MKISQTQRQATSEHSIRVAGVALLFYNYVTELDNEVELFWMHKWSLAKFLYLWNRYYSLVFAMVSESVWLFVHPNEELCKKYESASNIALAALALTTQAIMALRVCAMYGNSRRLLVIFLVLLVGELGLWWTLYGAGGGRLVITNEPILGFFQCAERDAPGKHWIAYFFLPLLGIDTLMVGMALSKAWALRRMKTGNRLMLKLAKQSAFYFAVGSIPPILAGRIMTSLRLAGCGGDDPPVTVFQSLRFVNRGEVSSGRTLDNVASMPDFAVGPR